MTKKKLSWHKKKAWEALSKYIRLKYADKYGWCTCYTCGKRSHWKDGMQAGHLLDGRNNSILFQEDCIRVQCTGCNMFKSGNKEIYIPKYIDEEGREKYDKMVRLKNKTVKFTRKELDDMRADWKAKARELEDKKGVA